jgi:hypothetical protein
MGILRKPVIAAILVGVALGALILSADFQRLSSNQDLSTYGSAAEQITKGDLMLEEFGRFAPGWSLYLALFYALIGPTNTTLVISHLLLFVAIIVLTYQCAREILGEEKAGSAALLVAVWPSLLFQMLNGSALLFYIVLLLLASFVFLKGASRLSLQSAVVSGLCLGLAALTDVVALFLPVVFLAWLLFREGSPGITRRSLLYALIFMTSFVAVVSVWAYRNVVVFGGFSNAPIVAKNEQRYFIPAVIRETSQIPDHANSAFVLEGIARIFVFPAGTYYLDTNTTLSYKKCILDMLTKRTGYDLTGREYAILFTKTLLTLLHWCLLVGVIWGVARYRDDSTSVFVVLLLIYVSVAVIGTAALSSTGFDSISMPSGFLVPLVPLLVIMFVRAVPIPLTSINGHHA